MASVEEQRKVARDCKVKPKVDGDLWYAVSIKWWRELELFLNGTTSSPPGAISNHLLRTFPEDPHYLTPMMMENVDYCTIHSEGWEQFVKWYGVEGPTISMQVIKTMYTLELEKNPLKLEIFVKLSRDHSNNTKRTIICSKRITVAELCAKTLDGLSSAPEKFQLRFWNFGKLTGNMFKPSQRLFEYNLSSNSRLAILDIDDDSIDFPEPISNTVRARTHQSSSSSSFSQSTPSSFPSTSTAFSGSSLNAVSSYNSGTNQGSQSNSSFSSSNRSSLYIDPNYTYSSSSNSSYRPASSLSTNIPSSYTYAPGSGSSTSSTFPSSLSSGLSATSSYGSSSSSSYNSSYSSSSSYSTRYVSSNAPGLCGLRNIGNTCYMASVLQSLAHIPDVVDAANNPSLAKMTNSKNPLGSGGVITRAFADLVKDLWSGRHSDISPTTLKSAMGERTRGFSGSLQQDASDFLMTLMSELHEDLKTDLKEEMRKTFADKEVLNMTDKELAEYRWEGFEQSLIFQMFNGLLKTAVKCQVCQKQLSRFDPYSLLPLQLPTNPRRRAVTFVYIDGMAHTKPTKYKLYVGEDATFEDLRKLIAEYQGCSAERLVLMTSSSLSQHVFYQDEKSVATTSDPICQYLSADVIDRAELVDSFGRKLFPLVIKLARNTSYASKLGQPRTVFLDPTAFTITDVIMQVKERILHLTGQTDDDMGDDADGLNVPRSISELPEKLQQMCAFIEVKILNQRENTITTLMQDREYSIPPETAWISVEIRGSLANKVPYGFEERAVVDASVSDQTRPTEVRATLQQCLQLLSTPGAVERDCSFCVGRQPSLKTVSIWRTPPVLIVYLKRFSVVGGSRTKNEMHVDFGQELDLNPFVDPLNTSESPQHNLYDLVSVVNHYGGLGGGHYTAFSKNHQTERWYKFDDSRVSEMDPSQISTSAAYILFYRRRRPAPVLSPEASSSSSSSSSSLSSLSTSAPNPSL